MRAEVMAESKREYAVSVLDPPSLPDQRYYPRRVRMVPDRALLGLFSALSVCYWQQPFGMEDRASDASVARYFAFE